MTRDILGLSDKAFYRKVFAVCLPIMLQQLLSTAMYMVDTIMIGGLGDIELAGVGAANQLAYLLDICLFGVTGGGSVFMAQYFGKKDLAGVRRTLGLCIVLAGACAALFVAVAQGFGGFCVGLFSEEAAVTAVWSIFPSPPGGICSKRSSIPSARSTNPPAMQSCPCFPALRGFL